MGKKQERVTVERVGEDSPDFNAIRYFLTCGDAFTWGDGYPPAFCPFCGRAIDYAGEEGAKDDTA